MPATTLAPPHDLPSSKLGKVGVPAAAGDHKRHVAKEGVARRSVWLIALAGSNLPEVLCYQVGWNAGLALPIAQTILLVGWAIYLFRSQNRTELAGFSLTIAALLFSWNVAVPWLEQSSVIQSLSQSLTWSGQFYLSRIIRVIGVVLISATFLGSGVGRDELFLQRGNWRMPVQMLHPIFRQITWRGLALTLGPLFSLVVAIYLLATMPANFARVSTLPLLLLSCVPIALLNAANEEFQFRSVLLARLTKMVSPNEAAILCGVVFGIGHFFGHPGGWGGALLTSFGGWVCARSMLETRGFTWAWIMHVVEDLLIFAFIALSATG